MLDATLIGYRFRPVEAVVEAGRLRAFHKAIGENNEAMIAPDASGAVAIPPTYLFCLEMLDAENPFGFIEEIGIGIEKILHADQSFNYHLPIHVGTRLRFEARVSDVIQKKNGMLTFIVQDVDVRDQDDRLAAEIRRTFVVRHAEAAA